MMKKRTNQNMDKINKEKKCQRKNTRNSPMLRSTFKLTENPLKTNLEPILYKPKNSVKLKNIVQSITRQKAPGDTVEFVLRGHLLLSMRPALTCALYTHWDSVRENSLLLCKRLSTGGGFWLRDEGVCLLPLSALGPHRV